MLPKSQRRAYVGYEDGPKAVQYYNAETRKVLTSRNYRFLELTHETPPTEPIAVIAPGAQREGELGRPERDTLSTGGVSDVQPKDLGQNMGSGNKRKRSEEEEDSPDQPPPEPRKTRGIRKDYRRLDNPFSDSKDEDMINVAGMETLGDDPKSLKEARESLEWPKWERAIEAELSQLGQMGTWTLTEAPADSIPIANKWVFTRKYGKAGNLLKYKARLVAKGYAQRPGYDYTETFSPVVRFETL
jgi:hypothetical protein